jgi:3-oxoacyl-[acyl-carrier protein] reductase
LKTAIHDFLKNHPPVHILINNSGGPPAGEAIDTEPEAFVEGAFSKQLICNQILTQVVVPGMKAEKYGRISNIISASVKQPIQGPGVSNTIRGAAASWSKTISTESGP